MMPKTLVSMMPRLSQPERDRAIGMLQAGRDRRAVAMQAVRGPPLDCCVS